MKVTILGSGAAPGVPSVSRGWGACNPDQPRNRRRRPCILLEEGRVRILIDTPPDIRDSLISQDIRWLSAVLYTHEHADHLHGIDDLREINRVMKTPLPIHASHATLESIRHRFGYTVKPHDGRPHFSRPVLIPHEIDGPLEIEGLRVVPFDQDHGWINTLGFRLGPVAYSTDVVRLPETAFTVLEGVSLWVVSCLTDQDHPTHAPLAEVLRWIDRVQPRLAVLTHMSPALDYDALKARLPAHVIPAFDGLSLETGDLPADPHRL